MVVDDDVDGRGYEAHTGDAAVPVPTLYYTPHLLFPAALGTPLHAPLVCSASVHKLLRTAL